MATSLKVLLIKASSLDTARDAFIKHFPSCAEVTFDQVSAREARAFARVDAIDLNEWMVEDVSLEAPYPQGSLLHWGDLKIGGGS